MRIFTKQRGQHRFQFYRLIHKGGKTVQQIVAIENGKQHIMHKKNIEAGNIDDYARENGFTEGGNV